MQTHKQLYDILPLAAYHYSVRVTQVLYGSALRQKLRVADYYEPLTVLRYALVAAYHLLQHSVG